MNWAGYAINLSNIFLFCNNYIPCYVFLKGPFEDRYQFFSELLEKLILVQLINSLKCMSVYLNVALTFDSVWHNGSFKLSNYSHILITYLENLSSKIVCFCCLAKL